MEVAFVPVRLLIKAVSVTDREEVGRNLTFPASSYTNTANRRCVLAFIPQLHQVSHLQMVAVPVTWAEIPSQCLYARRIRIGSVCIEMSAVKTGDLQISKIYNLWKKIEEYLGIFLKAFAKETNCKGDGKKCCPNVVTITQNRQQTTGSQNAFWNERWQFHFIFLSVQFPNVATQLLV